jgi:hypothetical protein
MFTSTAYGRNPIYMQAIKLQRQPLQCLHSPFQHAKLGPGTSPLSIPAHLVPGFSPPSDSESALHWRRVASRSISRSLVKKDALVPKVVNQTVSLFEARVVDVSHKAIVEWCGIKVDVCVVGFRAERESNMAKE